MHLSPRLAITLWLCFVSLVVCRPLAPPGVPLDSVSPLARRLLWNKRGVNHTGSIAGPVVAVIVSLVVVGGLSALVIRNRKRYREAFNNFRQPSSPSRLSFRPPTPQSGGAYASEKKQHKRNESSFHSPLPEKLSFVSDQADLQSLPYRSPPITRESATSWKEWADPSFTPTHGHLELSLTVTRPDSEVAPEDTQPLTPLAPVFDVLLGSRRGSTITNASIIPGLRTHHDLHQSARKERTRSKVLPPLPELSDEQLELSQVTETRYTPITLQSIPQPPTSTRHRPTPLDSSRFADADGETSFPLSEPTVVAHLSENTSPSSDCIASPPVFPFSPEYVSNMPQPVEESAKLPTRRKLPVPRSRVDTDLTNSLVSVSRVLPKCDPPATILPVPPANKLNSIHRRPLPVPGASSLP